MSEKNGELIEKITFAEPKNKSSGDPDQFYFLSDLQIKNSADNYLKVIPGGNEIDSDYEMIWTRIAFINVFTRPIHNQFKVSMNDFSFGEWLAFYWHENTAAVFFVCLAIAIVPCVFIIVFACKFCSQCLKNNNRPLEFE